MSTATIQWHASEPLIDLAYVLAAGTGTSLYDGLFLALAISLNGQVVTADKTFYEKVKAGPYAVHARWVEERP